MAVPSSLIDAEDGPWYAWAGMVGWQPVESTIFKNVEHELRCKSAKPSKE